MRPREIIGGLSFTGLAIGGTALLVPALPSQLALPAWLTLVAGAVGVAWLLLTREKENVMSGGDSYNNNGNNFGHMGPINIGSQNRRLTDEQKRQLLQIPRDKPVDVGAYMNDGEADAFAREIDAFLRASGFVMGTKGPFYFIPKETFVGVHMVVDPTMDTYEVKVGHKN